VPCVINRDGCTTDRSARASEGVFRANLAARRPAEVTGALQRDRRSMRQSDDNEAMLAAAS
jgi:hypothetical protein